MAHEHWMSEPEEHDFPAAKTYLSLLMADDLAGQVADLFRTAQTVTYEAKDLLRASRLTLLGRDNKHVAGDLLKIRSGQRLSPVLLVRGDAVSDLPLVVADGYHRICTSYWIDENTQIPCRMVSRPRG